VGRCRRAAGRRSDHRRHPRHDAQRERGHEHDDAQHRLLVLEQPPANFPAHGSAAHEDAEKPVTGSAASQAQAAAVKSVGSGTAGAVTTDFTGNGYEVTVTKSDGTSVEVHLDSSFTVMQGGPGRQGG
jgi:hypothetical protein